MKCKICGKESGEELLCYSCFTRKNNLATDYYEWAAYIGRLFGEKYYQYAIAEYALYKVSKEEGREALDGYINDCISRMHDLLQSKQRRL